jgi:hypothetical protein
MISIHVEVGQLNVIRYVYWLLGCMLCVIKGLEKSGCKK